eukprot:UN07520
MDESGKYKGKQLVSPFEDDIVTLEQLDDLVKYAQDDEKEELQRTLLNAQRYIQNNQDIREQHMDLFQRGELHKIPFKIQLRAKQMTPEQRKAIG